MGRQLQPCGTNAAYKRHLYYGETPCESCREARNAYDRAHRQTGYSKRGPLQPCGTEAAYQRHIRRDEPPCDPCREAKRDASRARAQTTP